GYDAFEHVKALLEHGARRPDVVLLNDTPIDKSRRASYREEHAEAVPLAHEQFAAAGIEVRQRPLLMAGDKAQHDSELLAVELVALAKAEQRQEPRRSGAAPGTASGTASGTVSA